VADHIGSSPDELSHLLFLAAYRCTPHLSRLKATDPDPLGFPQRRKALFAFAHGPRRAGSSARAPRFSREPRRPRARLGKAVRTAAPRLAIRRAVAAAATRSATGSKRHDVAWSPSPSLGAAFHGVKVANHREIVMREHLVLGSVLALLVAAPLALAASDPVKADGVKSSCNKAFEASVRWGAPSWMWKDAKKEDVTAACVKVLEAVAARCAKPEPKDRDWTQLTKIECQPTSKDKSKVSLNGGGTFTVTLAKPDAASLTKTAPNFIGALLPDKKK
jgi:hypothetical protein